MNINCSVCRELFSQADDIYSTPCGHVFHHACLVPWIESSSTCPQCRKTTAAENIFKIDFNISDTERDNQRAKVGDMVVIKDIHKAPLAWKLGRVITECPKPNKRATLMTCSGEMECDLQYLVTVNFYRNPTQQAKLGDLVIVKDLYKAPLAWELGVVVAKYPETGRAGVRLNSYCDAKTYNIEHLVPLSNF